MTDDSLARLTEAAARFADEREWRQFHTPKDLALSLTLEAAELAELMQWYFAAFFSSFPVEKSRGTVTKYTELVDDR
jgi:hypothetical protein